MAATRTIREFRLSNWMGTWFTANGQYEIAAEGQATTRCGAPHMVRNGMMCPGDTEHMHNVWWVFDSEQQIYPMGNKSFNTLNEAVFALDEFLKVRGK